jgi:hypothetical protein
MTKLIIAFYNSAKGPKNCVLSREYSVLLTILREKKRLSPSTPIKIGLHNGKSCVFSVMHKTEFLNII